MQYYLKFSPILFYLLNSVLFYCFIFSGNALSAPLKITLFHINDTYQIAPVQVKQRIDRSRGMGVDQGGMARIKSYVNNYRKTHPEIPALILHGGDMISPSVLSWKEGLKGKQMIDVLNRLPLSIAVFGNHEFDFGCKSLEKRVKETEFIWLASNIKFPDESSIFKKVKKIHIFEHEGVKIGFFGLTINFRSDMPCHQYEDGKIVFQDPEKSAKQAVQALKDSKVDIVIGVTHLNMSTDKKIARENPDIDVIVGGHEHIPLSALVGKTLIRKAGTDATDLGKIELSYFPPVGDNGRSVLEKNWELISVNNEIQPDSELKKIVDTYQARIKKYNTIFGSTEIPLEARSDCVRTHETNVGNLIADVIQIEGKGDMALINGGAIRADKIFAAGPITIADIYSLLPYNDKIVTIKIDGKTLIESLENGLVNWGSGKGRFPQVSGVKFMFAPDRPNFKKIIKDTVMVKEKPIELNKSYQLSTIDFIVERGEIDGYNMLKGKEVLGKYRFLTDALIEYIQKNKTISPTVDNRIVIKGIDPLAHYRCGDPDLVF